MGDRVFRFLFKYPLLVFEQGDFTLGIVSPALDRVIVAAAASPSPRSSATVACRRTHAAAIARSIALRLAAVAVLLFCLSAQR